MSDRTVRVALLILLATAVLTGSLPQRSLAGPLDDEMYVDHEETCEYDPNELVDAVLNDPGDTQDLRVLVLLDGPSRKRAEEVVREAGAAYAPLDIRLIAGFRAVRLEGKDRDPVALIEEARSLLKGHVPEGYDAVHVFTTKDIAGWGYAYCIGGIRTETLSFSVSEDAGDRAPTLTPDYEVPWLWGPLTAQVIAHELGHLMGGQHELANCVEGPLDGDVPRPCTLMDTSIAMTLKFSTANTTVVRAHAVKYLPRLGD